MVALKGTALALLPLFVASTLPVVAQEPTTKMETGPLPGYSAVASTSERDWEAKFRALPSTDNLREDMRRLSARPHNVGSPYDKDNAEWILAQFKQWGLNAEIETFYVLFPTPKERALELVAPTTYTAKLQEPPVAVDPTSNQQAEQLPTYNAYSIDGDVTAPLVYVNQGVRADYEQLDRMGVSVKGAIVIARYGGAWRGIKPKVAAEHGAVGCIIYSDPKDDGYSAGDTFPNGPYRPEQGVQRGAVTDTNYQGDPLTPGYGATKDAKRLPIKGNSQITKIPVLPISYGDAQPLLKAIGGQTVPREWRGGLPITYHVGPGPAKVHLKVESNWDIKPIYDVIARIPGSEFPDQWIIRGNHHDAWVNGAEDPISGQVALLEEARSMSELVKQGWKPKRTIIFCAWDGEEPGLLGSTEWVETHQDELRKKAVMYVNSDTNGRGFLGIEGSHTLEHFINGVARDVKDPETGLSVLRRTQLYSIAHPEGDGGRQELRSRPDLRIGALGSGSDYAPFLDFAGIASINLGFGGESGGGIYHSAYDDFYWYTHFADTDFVYGRALSQTAGTALMRMADAELLPFDFHDFADTVHTYIGELKKLLKDRQTEIEETNKELDEGVFTAVADPKRTSVPPARKAFPPYLNFAPLENADAALTEGADRFNKALAAARAKGDLSIDAQTLAEVNGLLIQSERRLTSDAGLPGRPWYKHQIYAPGAYTGYGVKTLPAVREAMEQENWKQAEEQVPLVAKVLEDEAALIDEITRQLSATRSGKPVEAAE
ncbi:MAG TPA: transferrin receptor-like dimerization domain-containing protein [Terracidiphilus sp.]|nr:transferrin receptor-like dimerization domain-containing protein [Terracidiphilus sp.]